MQAMHRARTQLIPRTAFIPRSAITIPTIQDFDEKDKNERDWGLVKNQIFIENETEKG